MTGGHSDHPHQPTLRDRDETIEEAYRRGFHHGVIAGTEAERPGQFLRAVTDWRMRGMIQGYRKIQAPPWRPR